ncbi:hypothetical protein HEBU111660_01380 [Helicobacter burdigaliensis]
MKKAFVLVGIVLALFVASGCEKADYQHPAQRSGAVK